MQFLSLAIVRSKSEATREIDTVASVLILPWNGQAGTLVPLSTLT